MRGVYFCFRQDVGVYFTKQQGERQRGGYWSVVQREVDAVHYVKKRICLMENDLVKINMVHN
jgi:acyl-coenzyme A synthetase/AMP-(fatty) acid ligase